MKNDDMTVGSILQSREIKDSGERRAFPTGAVRDMSEGKGRMDLLPWDAIIEISKHCERGAKKYGEHNVDKGIPMSSLCDSASRHLAKFLAGYTDENHLLAAAWNLLWAVQMDIGENESLKNVPFRKKPCALWNFHGVDYATEAEAKKAKEIWEQLQKYGKGE